MPWSRTVRRWQVLLIALGVVSFFVGSVIGRGHVVGAALIVVSLPAVVGGLLGVVIGGLARHAHPRSVGIAYSVLLVLGIAALAGFFVLRQRIEAPGIGFGMLLILGVMLSGSGLVGVAALLFAHRK